MCKGKDFVRGIEEIAGQPAMMNGNGEKGYIYFMMIASNKVLYVGVTSSLKRRIAEHAVGLFR